MVVADGGEAAVLVDVGAFAGKYTWVEDESKVGGTRKQISETIEKQREFQRRELAEFLEHCSYHLGMDISFTCLIDGTPIERLQEIPPDALCLVVSQHEHFLGVGQAPGIFVSTGRRSP